MTNSHVIDSSVFQKLFVMLITKIKLHSKFLFNTNRERIGVPQGSILSPLLCLCYLNNDFPKSVPAEIVVYLFANDTNITISGKNKDNIDELTSLFVSL